MKELFIFTSKADTTGYRTLTGCKEMMPACFCFLEQSTLATETGGHLQTSIAECQANEAEPKSFEYTVYMHVDATWNIKHNEKIGQSGAQSVSVTFSCGDEGLHCFSS